MGIDRIDANREDAKKVDEKRDDLRRDLKNRKPDSNFKLQYQSALANRRKSEPGDTQKNKSQTDSGEKKDPSLLARIVSAAKGKQDPQGESSKELLDRQDRKKEDTKKEKSAGGEEGRTSNVSEEGYMRVGANDSSRHQNEGRGGGQGQGGSQGGQSGSSGSQTGGQKSFEHRQESRGRVGAIDASGSDGRQSFSDQTLSDEILNEMVDSVVLKIHDGGAKELELTLSDGTLAGLVFSVLQSPDGLILTFKCPSRQSKNSILMSRPKLYSRLREKNINISRIDIE